MFIDYRAIPNTQKSNDLYITYNRYLLSVEKLRSAEATLISSEQIILRI